MCKIHWTIRSGDKFQPFAFDFPSVGATETLLMAAVLADGVSTIENAAQEPEVQDLANLLNSMGAQVSGAGGPVITVKGVERLHGCNNYPVQMI